jgi:signal transduction histidine kinase
VSTSLRSRLWLSHALVISVALGVVSLVLLVYIARNPLLYRQEAAKLLVVQSILTRNQGQWIDLPPQALQTYSDQLGSTYDTRILVLDGSRQIIADSGKTTSPALDLPRFPRLRPSSVVRDASGAMWLSLVRKLNNGNWLMVSTPRPAVPLRTILRDDLFLPVVGAGIVALVLSLFLAFFLSKWVGDPLQKMVVASRVMPDQKTTAVKPEGPKEVQELIRGFNDMTARIQASQQSQQRFVANVSHELKTPITVIQGFAQAILDGTADSPDRERQAAQTIYDESGRMNRLVLDLLDLARMDAGTLILKHEAVDMEALLGYVVERFQAHARDANVSLSLKGAHILNVYGDSDRLAQVFSNLVDNAIKFTPPGGSVTLLVSNDSEFLRVDISDTGKGIPSDSANHIFDRFYQVDSSRPGGVTHGSGLGLAIVKEIVNAHHGKIIVQSTIGQGSTFSVFLPISLPDASTLIRRRKS